jgi:hypothetical protein
MTPLFKKLNLGTQSVIHVLNAPASFEPELVALSGVKVARKVAGNVEFALAFVITQAELDAASSELSRSAAGDAIVWMVYPKQTSRKYKCEFHRDSGWQVLGGAGFEPVRMVAVDEDWSALRFRRAEYVKTMSRQPSGAISAVGKKKAAASRKSKSAATTKPNRPNQESQARKRPSR